MRTKHLCTLAILLAWFHSAEAQQSSNAATIGWLATRSAASGTGLDRLRRHLHSLGYVEGKNITFEFRSAGDKIDRLPALADDLVRRKVDVLVTPSTAEALAAKNATKTIPIICLNVGDPVALGLVDSLAHPGGNITGFSNITAVTAGKRLELLKEAIPKLSRVAILGIRMTRVPLRNGRKASTLDKNSVYRFIRWQ